MRSVCILFGIVLFLLNAVIVAAGQGFQGGLRGAVADQAGALIPGAAITITNEGTNATRSTLTNEAGQYVLGAIIPGTYKITAELPGFKVFERTGMTIGTQEFLTLDIRLDVGQVYINKAAYLIAPAYTFGDLARNVANIRTPSQTNLDVSLGKTTRVTESIKLTLRLEANNATNTPKFGGPNASLSSTTFGTITSQVGFSRQLQWMARVHW